MKLSVALKTIVFSGLALTSTQAFATNLISNFSFEEPIPTQNSGQWQVYSTINGWQTPLNYIEIQRNGLYGDAATNQAPDGYQWAEIDAPNSGTALGQSVATEAGATYKLSFFYSERPSYGFQELGVYWNNALVGVAGSALTISAENLNWREYSFSLVGAGTSGLLSFASLANFADANGAGGNLLDKVILTKVGSAEVPEPASLLLLSSGILVGRRFRKGKSL